MPYQRLRTPLLVVVAAALVSSGSVRADRLFGTPAPVAPPAPQGAPTCTSYIGNRPNAFSLGLMFQLLLPNRLEDFKNSLSSYGPVLGIPVGQDSIHVAGFYGASNGLSLFLVETGYRLNLTTPFFTGYLLGGAHFLHYSLNSHPHEFWGPDGGLGLSLAMSHNSTIDLAMKVYFQDRAIVAVGGGFNFLL